MSTDHTSSKSAGAGLLAAIVASLCCITPVFSVLAGVSGIAATFSWMEPFRPYLIALTIGVLGFAWYQKLKPRTKEEIDCACEPDDLPTGKAGKPSFWQSKKFLGMVTIFAALMLAFPSYSGIFFPKAKIDNTFIMEENGVIEATIQIKGMTCTGCEHSVNHALNNSEGVISASSSYQLGSAKVTFDPSKVTVEELAKAVEVKTGYTVTIPTKD